jgi:CRP-like cAMP-binding protein
VAIIPRAALQSLALSHPAIGHALFVNTLVEGSIFREWALNVGRRDARTRLAHFLCEFAARLDAQGLDGVRGYELPMSQEQIGDALGLTAVHVNRTMKLLESEGLIVRTKRRIGIPSWTTLREVADFSTRYLHVRTKTG